jgi:hypothetical protein
MLNKVDVAGKIKIKLKNLHNTPLGDGGKTKKQWQTILTLYH